MLQGIDLALGYAAVEMGDYEAAFTHYQRMLDIRPDLASYARGAHLLFLTGDPLDPRTWVDRVMIDGAFVYERAKDKFLQELIEGTKQ